VTRRACAALLLALALGGCKLIALEADQRRSQDEAVAPLVLGEVTSLDDERFSEKYGQRGMWTPFDFAARAGGGVFFLEPYDPDRIPVLFVAGMGGYPREFRGLIDALDKSRYQAWVYLYPSGGRLASAARLLNDSIETLHARHRFDQLYVTAYSIGGLVSRGFIQLNTASGENRYLRLFVSISTPWQGHRAAGNGVRFSPVVIPSWIDLQTNSDYQKAIFSRPLPPPLEYHLLWSRNGLDPAPERANDGVVYVTSELRPDAVLDARSVLGFRESHASMLTSADVIRAYRGILADADIRLQ
jgi:hypothetical protein